jgi:hypothetical protein
MIHRCIQVTATVLIGDVLTTENYSEQLSYVLRLMNVDTWDMIPKMRKYGMMTCI